MAEKLDQVEPGWKISGKYVRQLQVRPLAFGDDLNFQAVVLLSEGRPGEKVRFA